MSDEIQPDLPDKDKIDISGITEKLAKYERFWQVVMFLSIGLIMYSFGKLAYVGGSQKICLDQGMILDYKQYKCINPNQTQIIKPQDLNRDDFPDFKIEVKNGSNTSKLVPAFEEAQ